MKREGEYSHHDSIKAARYEGGGRGRGRGRDSWSSGPYYSDSREDYGRDFRGRGGRGAVRGRGRGRLAGKPPVFPLPEEPILVQDIPVKKEFAGAVIGVGGERVKKLREETGCKVHIKKTTPETLQIVELTGRMHEIEAAIQALQRIINDVEPNYILELPTKYSIYIDIYPDMVGCVIGRHGDRVKQVKQESGAHVRVEEQQPDSDFQVVSITGELHQVQSAYKMVAVNLDQFDPSRVKHRPMRPFSSQYAEPPYAGGGGGHGNDSYGPPGGGAEFGNYGYGNPAPMVAGGDFGAGGAVFAQGAMGGGGGAASTIVVNPGSTTGAGQAATPQVLVLQPDGTYKPVQAVVYSLPQGSGVAQAQQPLVINQAQLDQQHQPQAQQQQQQQQQQAVTGVSQVNLAGLTAALPAGARIISLSSLQDPATSSALTQLISPSGAANGVQQGIVGQIYTNPSTMYTTTAKQPGQQGLTQIVAQGGYS